MVEGGTFQMGSADISNARPVHSVTVSGFFMCRHEVTQAEWKAVMGNDNNPSQFPGDSRPVENVSWFEAVEYCNKRSLAESLQPCYSLNGDADTSAWGTKGSAWNGVECDFTKNGYRLPTEAEWEYAARGGKESRGYEYSGSSTPGEVAWSSENSGSKTHDVMTTPKANELGLYDMSGNVWEWCWDWDGNYGSGSQTDPRGASSGSNRVLRGGSWDYYAFYCRVACRDRRSPGYSNFYLGFRVVRSSSR